MVYRLTGRGEARRAERREQILKSARRLFVRQGYVDTTMLQVAKGARTSIGNLYFYFANKEGLLQALLESAMTREWARADAIAESIPPGPARLAVMVFCNGDWLLERDREMIKMLLESSAIRHLADWVAEQNAERTLRYLRTSLPDLIGPDPHVVVAMWVGAGRGSVEASVRSDGSRDQRSYAKALLRWNLRGLRVAEAQIAAAIQTAERVIAATTTNNIAPP